MNALKLADTMLFLSTLSLRRATPPSISCMTPMQFLSTLSLRRATPSTTRRLTNMMISIHALLAESDHAAHSFSFFGGISIHALLAESDVRMVLHKCADFLFLSTLSLRRATHFRVFPGSWQKFLSTLSLRRATGGTTTSLIAFDDFYPRSPCGERRIRLNMWRSNNDFYPRSPCGERPTELLEIDTGADISIHALLAESDVTSAALLATGQVFLSTLSLRRATGSPLIMPTIPVNFYPRSPCGERPK